MKTESDRSLEYSVSPSRRIFGVSKAQLTVDQRGIVSIGEDLKIE